MASVALLGEQPAVPVQNVLDVMRRLPAEARHFITNRTHGA
jgi:hypothetical protein